MTDMHAVTKPLVVRISGSTRPQSYRELKLRCSLLIAEEAGARIEPLQGTIRIQLQSLITQMLAAAEQRKLDQNGSSPPGWDPVIAGQEDTGASLTSATVPSTPEAGNKS